MPAPESMVERCARAINPQAFVAFDKWGRDTQARRLALWQAQRAIEAMREPAEAHLATLPKTKVIETWHVTYARLQKEGYWAALVEGSFASRISAEREAARMANDSKNANVSVTGPHQQEVPA